MDGKFYGAERFNPRLITTQIIVMQAGFYISFVTLTSCGNWLIGNPQVLSPLFDFRVYDWSTSLGFTISISLWLTALIMAVALRFTVERAKKCLDFVATYHIFHLSVTCFMAGFPTTLRWWAINVVALLVAVFLGEYICMLGEVKAIKLSKPAQPPDNV